MRVVSFDCVGSNMNKTTKQILLITALYAVATFICYNVINYTLSGWDLLGGIIAMLLTLPIYFLLVTIPIYVKISKEIKQAPALLNNKLEKVLNTLSIWCACISAVCLIPCFIAINFHIKNDVLRMLFSDAAIYTTFFSSIINISVLISRKLSYLVVFFAQKSNKNVTINSKGVFAFRIFATVIVPLLLLIYVIGEVI